MTGTHTPGTQPGEFSFTLEEKGERDKEHSMTTAKPPNSLLLEA